MPAMGEDADSRPPDIEHANLSALWSQRGPATA
jgi:hypothetical protein